MTTDRDDIAISILRTAREVCCRYHAADHLADHDIGNHCAVAVNNTAYVILADLGFSLGEVNFYLNQLQIEDGVNQTWQTTATLN